MRPSPHPSRLAEEGSHLRTTTTIEQMARMAKQINAVVAADKAVALTLTPVSRETALRRRRRQSLPSRFPSQIRTQNAERGRRQAVEPTRLPNRARTRSLKL